MAERNVLIEAIDTEAKGAYQVLRLAIQPPIAVHDPSFLDNAIRRRLSATGYQYCFGDFPYVDNVKLTFADDEATHGTITVHTGANPPELRELITTAFTDELNPLGSVALSFNFDANFPQPTG